ncbi:hypothetical protein AB3N58_01930 [Leptospira sp. WS60.C2]
MKRNIMFLLSILTLLVTSFLNCASQSIRNGDDILTINSLNILENNKQLTEGKLKKIEVEAIPFLKNKKDYHKDYSIYYGKLFLLIPIGKKNIEISDFYEYCPRGGVIYYNPGVHLFIPSLFTFFTLPILYHEVGIEISCK